MDVKLRVLTCMVLEQMDKHPDCANQLGLDNVSEFYGEREILLKGGT